MVALALQSDAAEFDVSPDPVKAVRASAEREVLARSALAFVAKAGDADLHPRVKELVRGDQWDRKLVSAFAVEGLRAELELGADGSLIEAFVQGAEALALRLDYPIYEFIDETLDPDTAVIVWREFASSALEAVPRSGLEMEAKRLAMLSTRSSRAAQEMGRRIAEQATNAEVRAVARALFPLEQISGVLRRRTRSVPARLLRIASGWALLCALGRFLLWLVRFERHGRFELTGAGVEISEMQTVLGREWRRSVSLVPFSSIERLGWAKHQDAVFIVAGLVSFIMGVLSGGAILIEGGLAGQPLGVLLGAAVIAVGASLDFFFSRRRRVGVGAVELLTHAGRAVELCDVSEMTGTSFLDAAKSCPLKPRESS